jgi:hypothetical protein
MRIRTALLALTVAGLSAGCGGEKLGRVKGQVTCQGKPFYPATVTFSPVTEKEGALEAGKPAWGVTDESGHFVLTTTRQGDGALVGKHRVTINVEYPDRVPCRGYQKVQIVVEVKEGDNEINLRLDDYEKK